jgi:exodeoxyribonuclease V beta subunit
MSAPSLLTLDPTGPLPLGTSLVEASAGTGKTWNITNLVLRLVGEYGLLLPQVLVVTFTRKATAELKDRIRQRLAEGLAVIEGRKEPAADDEVLRWMRGIATDDPAASERWQTRLARAQEEFDQCPISTIHGFCQRMLQQNAFESGADFGLELLTDTRDQRQELVDDWLSRELYPDDPARYDFHKTACGFNRKSLSKLADLALRDPDMPVVPDVGDSARAWMEWRVALEEFERSWSGGWRTALPQAVEDAGSAGVFTPPRQSTYRLKRAEAEASVVADWVLGQKSAGVPMALEGAAWWSEAAVSSKLADPSAPFEHEAMTAVRSLFVWEGRLAALRRAEFVAWLRAEFDRRSAEQAVQSYQDLVRQLAARLRPGAEPEVREGLVDAIGGRFKVALIDEFQDTDDLQWTIFSSLFGSPDHRLFLIGDPKQAIYGFRGANVQVYRAAREMARAGTFTMKVNHRSDQRLVDAMNHLMDRPGFFDEEFIDYVQVTASERNQLDGLAWPEGTGDAVPPSLQIRFADGAFLPKVRKGDEPLNKGELEAGLPARVAEDIVDLLESGATLLDPAHSDADADGRRLLDPADLAVLVRTGDQGRAVADALREVGVPAVLSGTDSVLASDEARELHMWLRALSEPGRDGAARAAATTRAFGRTASDLLDLEAEEPAAVASWDRWMASLARWRELVADKGLMHALRDAMSAEGVAGRLLRRPDGDRRLTNLLHVAELVHAAATEQRLHLAGITAWLADARVRSSLDEDAVQLRLDRDDSAVTILTIHKAKGLQFAVVFVPFAWKDRLPGKGDAGFVLPVPGDPARRFLDLRTDDEEVRKAATLVSRREALRLLYVAVTRARHRCVLYTGWVKDLEMSALGPALHGDPAGGTNAAASPPVDRLRQAEAWIGLGSAAVWEDLQVLADTSGDGAPTIAVSRCSPAEGTTWTGRAPGGRKLAAREFKRRGLDHLWRRYSYTALTRGKSVTYAEEDGREGFDGDAIDETDAVDAPTVADPWMPRTVVPEDAPDVPLACFRAGAAAGTFLHEVFENLDFRLLDPGADPEIGRLHLRQQLTDLLTRHGFDAGRWLEPLTDGITPVLQTPLGGPLGELRLCDIPRAQRFDELRFDFPIAGGGAFGQDGRRDRVTSKVLTGALQLRQADDVMRHPYLEGLSSLRLGALAGFMTGSIDLVFRAQAGGRPRWFVVDYKSNKLDPMRTRRSPVEHYAPEGLRYAMEQHHYYLQYHIYTLALHRYLRWRLGDAYDPAEDLGGIYYLFIRGMVGAQTTRQGRRVFGCFHDRPPVEVIEALDRVIERPSDGRGGDR